MTSAVEPATARHDYDLLVIGSGPGGQKAAIAAAKLGKRVAVVERRGMVGGVCTQTGTIPSKTLREAVLYLTGYAMRGLYGESYRVKQDITVQDLLARTHFVIGREVEVIRAQLQRNRVDLLSGAARFLDDLARGQIVGDDYGMLKLLVSPDDHALLGVHVFGTSATELVHIGQAIMGCGGTVDYLVEAVLNYPTLSEAYKVAALDATNKIRALRAM